MEVSSSDLQSLLRTVNQIKLHQLIKNHDKPRQTQSCLDKTTIKHT